MKERERPAEPDNVQEPKTLASHLMQYDCESDWDVEKELLARQSRRDEGKSAARTPAHMPRQTLSQSAQRQRAKNGDASPYRQSRASGRRRKKRRVNVRGWLILIALALTALLIVGGMIYLVVGAFIPDDEPTEVSEPTEPTEATLSREAIISDLISRAEPLAQMYDYDAAIAVLREFGADWQQQPELAAANSRYLEAKEKCVRWADTTQITHIFFHSLIVDTDRAFDGDYTNGGYNQYMATVGEFRAILNELYARGFVLVRLHDIVKQTANENGEMVYEQGDIYLPPGKTPFILSQDDVNYYQYMVDSDGDKLPDAGGDGFANRLVVGDDGHPTCEYVTADGQTVYGEYDIVPILEAFVREHPDFSYRGAKAIMAVTGYEGVFGYHTHPDWKNTLGEDAYAEEIRKAQDLTKCLKGHGYEIASHSFGHPSYGNLSSEEVEADIRKWENQVQPIVGDSDIFIYPYGSDIAGVENYSGAKFNALYAAGYRFFCNVDSTRYWVQIHDNYVRQGRRNIDGYRMWWDPELLEDLFDVEAIFDPARPTPVPSIV